ncbi:DUF3515 family protein [Streptomyces albidoflavus]|uniref:DUF3515 family protein n=1 Tax=Streptomyces TaxID=1883 RepID=UPI00069F2E75|nr:DUF3515 family protein [Streptomyces sp. KE1]
MAALRVPRRLSRRTALLAGGVCVLALGGAVVWAAGPFGGPPAGVEAAARGADPACAGVVDRVPGELAGRELAGGSPPGVAVWGGGEVVLRCGFAPPPATVEHCVDIDGVDWVLEEAQRTGSTELISYGRAPAVRLTLAEGFDRTDTALIELSAAVASIRQERQCV